MSSPKHLWSGDWESESAAAARERAGREIPVTEPAPETPPPAPPPPPAPKPRSRPPRSRPPRSRPPLPRPRVTRTVVVVALATLVLAAGAYGLVSLTGSGNSGSAAAARPTPWLGLNMETLPVNRVMIVAVNPGGPANRAGLGPGDVITSIDSSPVGAPGDVSAAISKLRPGDTVSIQVQRGPLTYTTRATLEARPSNYP